MSDVLEKLHEEIGRLRAENEQLRVEVSETQDEMDGEIQAAKMHIDAYLEANERLRAERDRALDRIAEMAAEVERTSVPSIEVAHAMGAKGSPVVEGERLAFEAWMRGHCWALSATWDGKTYRGSAEHGQYVCPHAIMTRQLWAAWRDRAALAAAPKPEAGE